MNNQTGNIDISFRFNNQSKSIRYWLLTLFYFWKFWFRYGESMILIVFLIVFHKLLQQQQKTANHPVWVSFLIPTQLWKWFLNHRLTLSFWDRLWRPLLLLVLSATFSGSIDNGRKPFQATGSAEQTKCVLPTSSCHRLIGENNSLSFRSESIVRPLRCCFSFVKIWWKLAILLTACNLTNRRCLIVILFYFLDVHRIVVCVEQQ